MRLNKLIKKLAGFNKLDILDMTGMRMYPVASVKEFRDNNEVIKKKYKVLQIIAFTQEPGVITVYVEEIQNNEN